MKSILFNLSFILNIITKKFNNPYNYLNRKYGPNFKTEFRRLENKLRQRNKVQLDLQFLLHCRATHVFPNFIQYKLYKKQLYHSQFYTESLCKLLDLEIKSKEKIKSNLSKIIIPLENSIISSAIFLHSIFIKFSLH